MVVLYISIIMLMRIVQSVLNKRTANMLPRNACCYLKYTAYYQSVAGAIACIVMLVALFGGGAAPQLGKTIVYASISGIALGLSNVLSKYILGLTSMALASIFSTAGLLVPAVVGIFLFGESMIWYQWIAIAVFMAGSYLLIGNSKKIYKKFTPKTLLLLILSLFSGGTTMLMQKVFAMQVEGGNASLFSFVTFASGVAVALVTLGIISLVAQNARKKESSMRPVVYTADEAVATISENEAVAPASEPFRFIVTDKRATRLPRIIYLFGMALAVAVFLINQLATLSAGLLPSVVLFTLINGGATVISALVGWIVYKEKLTIKGIIGLVLGIGALIMVQI